MDDRQTLYLRGVVGRGQGLAKGWIGEDPAVWGFLAPNLYLDGTLNVYVSANVPTFEQDFHASRLRAAGHIRAVPCNLNACNAFILRIESPGFHPLRTPPSTMLEIIAPKIDVREGDFVFVEFDPSNIIHHPISWNGLP